MLGTKRRTFGNIVGHVQGREGHARAVAWTAEQFDPTLNWDDVKRIKDRWGGKLILKGILDPEDAELAVAQRRRRDDRLQPRRPAARRRHVVHRALARHRQSRRQPHRGADGRRHPLRPGRAQGAGARRQGRA